MSIHRYIGPWSHGGPILKTRGVSRRVDPRWPVGTMQQGDPGIFGFLGGVIKGVGKVAGFIPGIGSTIEKVTNLAGGGLQSMDQPKTTGQAVRLGQTTQNFPGSFPSLATGPGMNFAGQRPMTSPGSMMPTLSTVGMSMPGPGQPGRLVQTSRNIGLTSVDRPPTGMHLNKTGYHLLNGQWVDPGTRWVKNRRTNPLNPSALSRSMRRMAGFARASKGMRQDAGRVATAIAGPKRSACGCGKKKR